MNDTPSLDVALDAMNRRAEAIARALEQDGYTAPATEPCAICKRPKDDKTHRPGTFYHHTFAPATHTFAPATEPSRLDHHTLTHLIARARGREDAIEVEDNRLAEVLLSEMKAAGHPVTWDGPDPSHYTDDHRRAVR